MSRPEHHSRLSELSSRKGDALIRIETTEKKLATFTPLRRGDGRAPQLNRKTNTLLLPFGSSALLTVDGDDLLFKHFKKRGFHDIGMILAIHGGRLLRDDGRDNPTDYMVGGTETFFTTPRFRSPLGDDIVLIGRFIF